MGQAPVKCKKEHTKGIRIIIQNVEEEGLLVAEKEPPDPKPLRKNLPSVGAKFGELKFVELKLREHRAGAHPLVMASCVH